jgi:hypothetical protein
MENKINVPTETVELPSKGLVYSKDNPLSSGTIEMKYMTAKEEDILTNQSYIQKGIVLDKLMTSLIVSKINYDDLIVGDKNAVMVASRVLGYGKDYKFKYNNEHHEVDLSTLENKIIDETLFTPGVNEFSFILPASQTPITFRLLTGHEEKKIEAEINGMKKVNSNISAELSTRMKYIITSVNGDRDTKTIREYVDTALLARDSRALRDHIKAIQPDVDLTFFPLGSNESISIPIGLSFFWPDYE